MADRRIKLRVLRQILRRYQVWEDSSLGKGSHTTFLRNMPGGTFSYPIPTHGTDVPVPYIREMRKKFGLTQADGVTDHEFYEG